MSKVITHQGITLVFAFVLQTKIFFPTDLGHKSKGKNEDLYLAVQTKKTRFNSTIFDISTVYLTALGTISSHMERLEISNTPQKQTDSI